MAIHLTTEYVKQRWKGGKDKPTIINGDFTTPFSVMSKAS